MHIRCPHCRDLIEVIDDDELRDIACPSCGSSFNLLPDETVSRQSPVHRTLGKFELIERIGIGAFGEVWTARDSELDRTVAIKVPRKGQLTTDEAEAFLREARSAAQLHHPNIVTVHEVGKEDGQLFIVSDFIQGVTLADWLTGKQPTPKEAAELCAKLAAAVQHAHENGVIHRDLKPSNIMLDGDDQPHIMDFGLAKRDAGEITMTMTGRVLGTPAYMSPEQAKGAAHNADQRSDVYSLGVVLFELLTGELPFRGNARMLLHQVINQDPPGPRQLNHRVSADLDTICLKCLEKDPDKRYQSAVTLSQDLRRNLAGEPIQARPVSKLERGWRSCKRNPVVTSLAIGLVVVLSGGLGTTTWQWIQTKMEAERNRHFLYVSEMYVAGKAWEENNIKMVAGILDRWKDPRYETMHGFEWYYLKGLCRRANDARIIPQHDRVRTMTLAPGGKQLALGFGHGEVHLVDLNPIRDIGRLRERSRTLPISVLGLAIRGVPSFGWERPCVTFSPGGDALACPSADYSQMVIYSIPSGKELQRTQPREGFVVNAAAFCPTTGPLSLATGWSDGIVRVWRENPADYDEFATRRASTAMSIAFSDDGRYLAVGSFDGSIVIWHVQMQEKIKTLKGHSAGVWALTFGRNEQVLVSGSMDATVKIWEWENGTSTTLVGHSDEVRSVAISPDGKLLASGSRDNTAIIWDAKTGREIDQLKGHSHNVESVVFREDGQGTGTSRLELITASSDNTLKRWNVDQRKRNVLFDPDSSPPMAMSPDGRQLASVRRVSGQDNVRVITQWNLDTDMSRDVTIPMESEVCAIAMSDRYLAAGTRHKMHLIRLRGATGEEKQLDAGTDLSVCAATFSRNGRWLAAGTLDCGVMLWDVTTGRRDVLVQPRDTVHSLTVLSFSPRGDIMAVGYEDGRLQFLEQGTGRLIQEVSPDSQRVYCVAFSNDGSLFVSGSASGNVRTWSRQVDGKWKEGLPLVGHSDNISAVMFPTDQNTLITTSHDCYLKIWDLHERRVRLSLRERRSIDAACISADGNCLASWCRNGSLRIWRTDQNAQPK